MTELDDAIEYFGEDRLDKWISFLEKMGCPDHMLRMVVVMMQAAARQSPGWQPIHTAPKDGSHVHVWWDGRCVESYWIERSHKDPRYLFGWQIPSFASLNGQPTYWMPLPTPP